MQSFAETIKTLNRIQAIFGESAKYCARKIYFYNSRNIVCVIPSFKQNTLSQVCSGLCSLCRTMRVQNLTKVTFQSRLIGEANFVHSNPYNDFYCFYGIPNI
jgi:hypothetical protein